MKFDRRTLLKRTAAGLMLPVAAKLEPIAAEPVAPIEPVRRFWPGWNKPAPRPVASRYIPKMLGLPIDWINGDVRVVLHTGEGGTIEGDLTGRRIEHVDRVTMFDATDVVWTNLDYATYVEYAEVREDDRPLVRIPMHLAVQPFDDVKIVWDAGGVIKVSYD